MVGILELTHSVYLCALESIKNIAGIPDVYIHLCRYVDSAGKALMACGK